MRKLPVNTDDWSGKYKGKTPANTDVNKFMNYVGDDDFFNFIPTQKRVYMTQSGMYKEALKKGSVVGDIAPTGMQSVSVPKQDLMVRTLNFSKELGKAIERKQISKSQFEEIRDYEDTLKNSKISREEALNELEARLQSTIKNNLMRHMDSPVKFGDPIKDKKWIIYGLIAVAGYFAYKKFK